MPTDPLMACPKTITLSSGTAVTLRALTGRHREAIWRFFEGWSDARAIGILRGR